MAPVGKSHLSSWTLKSLRAHLLPTGTGTCIPRRWCGQPGGKRLETIRRYKRNITKVNVARITLQRLIFDPCSCFLESEPSPPLEIPRCVPDPIPVKAVGMPWSLTRKLGCFTPEEENSCGFFFSFPCYSPFLTISHPGSPRQIASPFPAWALSEQVLYERTPTQRNMGLQNEKTLVNFN